MIEKDEKGTAAFRRLCVETLNSSLGVKFSDQPPSGGCVLKHRFVGDNLGADEAAAAFRRLCVETSQGTPLKEITKASRLQAAVC